MLHVNEDTVQRHKVFWEIQFAFLSDQVFIILIAQSCDHSSDVKEKCLGLWRTKLSKIIVFLKYNSFQITLGEMISLCLILYISKKYKKYLSFFQTISYKIDFSFNDSYINIVSLTLSFDFLVADMETANFFLQKSLNGE